MESTLESLPTALKNYLAHTVEGISIRAISRDENVSASTILRRVRKYELRRDEPLVDEALDALSAVYALQFPQPQLELSLMPATAMPTLELSESVIAREARRILRRLCEKEAFLLVSPNMDKAAVFKETVPGRMTRLAVVDRDAVRAFALREWIEGGDTGRVVKYYITPTGRTSLKRLIAEEKKDRTHAMTPFQEQHQVFGERTVRGINGEKEETVRYNLAESPLSLLARKKDKSGDVFLSPDLLEAGERLREDFERAHLGPRVAQNWERFLTGVSSPVGGSGGGGSEAAHERVSAALKTLGPGLADIVLRVCCFLDGLEKAEKRLGWSARSGKIVLKIALGRLAEHYGIAVHDKIRKAG